MSEIKQNPEVKKLQDRKKAIELLLKGKNIIGVNIQKPADYDILIEEIKVINKTLRLILTES